MTEQERREKTQASLNEAKREYEARIAEILYESVKEPVFSRPQFAKSRTYLDRDTFMPHIVLNCQCRYSPEMVQDLRSMANQQRQEEIAEEFGQFMKEAFLQATRKNPIHLQAEEYTALPGEFAAFPVQEDCGEKNSCSE